MYQIRIIAVVDSILVMFYSRQQKCLVTEIVHCFGVTLIAGKIDIEIATYNYMSLKMTVNDQCDQFSKNS